MFPPLEIRSMCLLCLDRTILGFFQYLKEWKFGTFGRRWSSPNCCDLEENDLRNMCALCSELVKRGKGVFAMAFCWRNSEILISRVFFQNCLLEVGKKRHLRVFTSPKLQFKETIMWSLIFQNCLWNCLAFGPPAEKWCQWVQSLLSLGEKPAAVYSTDHHNLSELPGVQQL